MCVPVITVYAVCSGLPLQSVILFRFWKTTVAAACVFEGSSALFLFVVETNRLALTNSQPIQEKGGSSTTKASPSLRVSLPLPNWDLDC